MNTFRSRLLSWLCLVFLPLLGLSSALGASCTLVWDANTEPGVAGYYVYCGTSSRHYTQAVRVENATQLPWGDLQPGTTYYFAVTAYAADGQESDPSLEVSYSVPQPPISTWQNQWFSPTDLTDPSKEATYWGDLADPDGDGRNNVLEYALGLSPLSASDGNQGVVSEMTNDVSGCHQYLSFLRRTNDPGLVYVPQVSGDKRTWQSDAGSVQVVAVSGVNAEFEQVTYKDLSTVVAGHPRFFQLKVMRNGSAVGTTDVYVATGTTILGKVNGSSRLSYFSLSMVPPWVACGTVTALGANTLSDANAAWTNDQFNGSNGAFYLEFASGLTVDIVDTDGPTRTLVLPGDFRSVLSVGEVYKIRKHVTLTDVFGLHNEAGLLGSDQPSRADNVILYDGASQTSQLYFYCNAAGNEGWYRGDFQPATNVTIYPEQGIKIIRKAAGDLTVYLQGMTKEGSTWATISPGLNLVGLVKSYKSLKLSELNLVTGNPVTGLAGGSNPSLSDNLVIPLGNVSLLYFYCNVPGNEGWYDASFQPADNLELPPGVPVFIKRKAGRPSFEWVIPAE